MERVATQLLGEIAEELDSRDIAVSFAPEVAPWLVGKLKARSHKHALGSSRQLRTLLREELEDPLALELMAAPAGGPGWRVVLGEDGLEFKRDKRVKGKSQQILA